MLKKILSIFHRKEEERKAKFLRGLVIGIIAAVVILAIAIPLIMRNSGSGPAKLKLTVITKPDCTQCWDVGLLTEALAQYKVKITGTTTLDYSSGKGKKLVEKYGIDKVPSVIISGDLDKDPALKPFWEALGEIDGKDFVFRQVIPPYIDVASGQLKGAVQVTYLTDNSCKECYDVTLHGNALRNLAIPTTDSKTIDVASDEGKALVKKNGIKSVPTVTISGETSEYQSLADLWEQVGTVASDGTYVFTQTQLMGTYKDLSTGKVVIPPTEE